MALHGVDRIFLELAKICQREYDGGSESNLQCPKQEAELDRGNMRVHSKGVSGMLFFNIVPLTVVLVTEWDVHPRHIECISCVH